MIATVNGVDLFYETVGQGRPIIFMHGGLGLDHAYFRPWLDPLADHYQLIFFDTSGNGRSPRPNGFEGVSHETWVEEADALRAHLGLERIILFGHSYGSFLSMEYAIRHADRLDGLILADAAPALDYPEIVVGNAQKRGTPEQVTTVIEALTSPADSDGAFRKIWNTIAPLYYHHFDSEIAADIDRRTHYSAGGFNHAFGVCVPLYNVESRLDEIPTRTLILTGREDWITPPEQGERINSRLSDSELVIFEQSGHFPFIEEQTAFLRVVRTWLSDLP